MFVVRQNHARLTKLFQALGRLLNEAAHDFNLPAGSKEWP